MKKKFLIFILILMIGAISAGVVSAQTLSPEQIGETFNKAILREQFINKTNMQYYRFAKNIWYYDNLNLSYFPSETVTETYYENPDNFKMNFKDSVYHPMTEKDWALLGREMTGKAAKQIIYLTEPAEYDVIHGLDFPRVTYQENFYLYTDLFILDSYPENSGSCYVYFSNSIIAGNRDSYGILIDPRSGIYKMSQNYDYANIMNNSKHSGYYLSGYGLETHGMQLLQELDPAQYEGKYDSIGNDIFPNENIDTRFNEDFEALKQSAIKDGMTENISAYRIEIIRLNGETSVYINGTFVAEFEDEIITDGTSYVSNRNGDKQYITIRGARVDILSINGTDLLEDVKITRIDDDTWSVYDPSTVNKLVSWTIGPRLYKGGETVTMAAGNLIILGTN